MSNRRQGSSPFLYDATGKIVGAFTEDAGETVFAVSNPTGTANTELAGFDASGNVVPVPISGASIVNGELVITGGGSGFSALTISVTGSRTEPWAFVRTMPQPTDDGNGTLVGATGKWISSFSVPTQTGINTVEFTDLTGTTTTFAFLATFPNATSIGYPALAAYPGNFNYGGPYGGAALSNLTNLDLSGLETLQGNLDVYGTSAFPVLTTLDLSSLKTATGYLAPQFPSVTAFNWLALEQCTFIVIGSCPALTTISTPALIQLTGDSTAGSIYVSSGTSALTTWLCPSTLMACAAGVNMTGPSLDQASVDSWLVRLSQLDGTNGTTLFQNQAVTLAGGSAAPSATGAAAAAVLVSRGCTVTTN